ncbi:Ankyrin repeats (3 copies) [Legionella drozanskii LLAP-1]|uniref:Ankyrin repeats (3 copies) n=2 Tax=Legionella TaxID=445 RepID=A0A0W0T881_9GAMM|nr:hypothetical protein [Legionella drozanskii]KTC91804.1 Ankyrin repeats (3 copies) [Legionella drozanskii LLAP-1]
MIISLTLQWIHSHEIDTLFPDHRITSSELAKEYSQVKEINRQLIAQARIAKLSASSPFAAHEKLEQSHQLLNFIDLSLPYIKDESCDLLLSALSYLLLIPQEKQPPKSEEKILFLFNQLIHEDKAAALDFYNQNNALFANHNEINQHVDRVIKLGKALPLVKHQLAELKNILKNQENPLGLVNLIKEESVDNTEKYAAFILWLIQRRVPVKQIIASHLLHDFMCYHLAYLGSPQCEINHLYDILNEFPEAQSLIAEAKKVSCGERGFLKFALDGSRGENLRQVEALPVAWEFSPNTDNFTALVDLFSQSFLPAAVIWFAQTENPDWFDLLNRHLNQPVVIANQLPALINYVGRLNKPLLASVLAKLIDDSTAEQLAANHDGAILYLLADKPSLIQQIQTEDVHAYIKQMSATANIDTIMQLLVLLKILIRNQHPSANIVFDALIDNLYHHPQLLDDNTLVHQLKRYPAWSHQLKSRSDFLHVQLATCIEENTKDELDSSRYNFMEDVWLEINRKLAVIHSLDQQLHSEPRNKYFLLAQIACSSYRKLGSNFNIDRFIEALSLPDLRSEEGISLHERTLVEVLTAIDDESIRKELIAKLEGEPISCLNWMTKDYGETSVFIKAAGQGNKGLLRLMGAQHRVEKQCWNAATLIAAQTGHWSTVSYLCRIAPKKIFRDTLSKVLVLAAQAGELSIVNQICDRATFFSLKATYPQGLEAAVINNHLPIVIQLYTPSGYKPSKNMSEKLFTLALRYKRFSIATYLCDLPNAFAPHQVQINNAFKQAIAKNDIDTVQCLGNLTTLKPDPLIFSQGFKTAASLGLTPMLVCLSTLPGTTIDKTLLKNSIAEAASQGRLTTLIELLKMTPSSAHKEAVAISLQAATMAGQLFITKIVCEHTPPSTTLQQTIDSLFVWAIQSKKPQAAESFCKLTINRPRPSALTKALSEAIKNGYSDLINLICQALSPLKQECINDSILLAIKHQRADILVCLYELPENKPNAKFIRIAIDRARSSQQVKIVNYLQSKFTDLKKERNVAEQLENFGVFKYKTEGEQIQASRSYTY